MSATAALAPDAAMALGIAATALPFARTPEEEAERWLRILRMHGRSGVALQALGVGEAPLQSAAGTGAARASSPPPERDTIDTVTEQASAIAGGRGAVAVGTSDLLLAVIRIYGDDFDRVLRAHGTDREEVIDRLAYDPHSPSADDPRR